VGLRDKSRRINAISALMMAVTQGTKGAKSQISKYVENIGDIVNGWRMTNFEP